MKLLQNPFVVGLLAVAAVAVVLHALWPMLPHAQSPKPQTDPPVSAQKPVSKSSPAAPAPAAPATGSAMTTTKQAPVRTDARRWAGTPRRDPFQNSNGANPTGGTGPDTAQKLVLNSILRQTGNSVAVINNRVVGEGDLIAGYRIEKIEADQIRVNGPNGREMIRFKPDLSTQSSRPRDVPEQASSHDNSAEP